MLIPDEGVAQRALFIIDPKGIVRSITVNDADIGRSVDETQRVLDALIFKDEFGEGCPIDWRKGDKGIDVAAPNKIEGSVEVPGKKSWTEWARPKLNRAFSGASQRSVASFTSVPVGSSGRQRSGSNLSGDGIQPPNLSPPTSGMSSGNRSPLVSPHSFIGNQPGSMQAAMDEAIMQQRMDNLRAVMSNQARNDSQQSAIGMAN